MEQFHCKKCGITQKFPQAYPGKTVYSEGICGDCGDKERASRDTMPSPPDDTRQEG